MVYGLEVGDIVRFPDEPDWGIGQVQSIVGEKISVNFEHRGKVVLLGSLVSLERISGDEF